MKVPWREYWEFLDAIVDIQTADGLRQFEAYLRHRLKELIDVRAAEREQQDLLHNVSLCQLMQLLNLSDSSPVNFSEPQADRSQDDGVLPEAQCTAYTTWPPSLARLRKPDSSATKVAENSVSDIRILSSTAPDIDESSGRHQCDEQSDHLSACSSDSFHTADDDSDLEFDVVSDWPDGFEWQAVEPMFICGSVLNFSLTVVPYIAFCISL